MTTWSAVIEHLAASYPVDTLGPDEVAVTEHRTVDGVQRAQRVMLTRYRAFDSEMIEFRSAFGTVTSYDPIELLTEALRLPIGGIALHGEYLVLLHKADLDDLSLGAVVRILTRVSLLADVLEGRTGTDRF